jgi:hypothetical protein
MRAKVYVETTIVSYLTARPSRDLLTAAHQQVTQDWWAHRRPKFDLYVSQFVVTEVSAGDPEAARQRLALLDGIPLLSPNETALRLAEDLVRNGPIPKKAAADAAHIALATVHGMDFLLTWNCTHIANAEMRVAMEAACQGRGLLLPILCTPEELMGEEEHVAR